MIKHGKAPFLECSSNGDRRFSAFYAFVDGRSIEERYQAAKRFADGSTGLSWREAKGRKPTNAGEVGKLYENLWRRYLEQHQELIDVLLAASGVSDKFGQEGHNCQATVLWSLRRRYTVDGIEHISVYDVQVDAESERHRLALDGLKRKLEHLQSTCPHKKTFFEADPAGDSSESTHTCVACGKVL